jgi:hypothetical protein
MERPHIHFIDWMKSLGMFLIVFGHVAGGSVVHTDPTNLSCATRRGILHLCHRMGTSTRIAGPLSGRLQPLVSVLFLNGFAMVMSLVVFVTQRHLNTSNYLPFFLGINVLLDNFPANPTTGTSAPISTCSCSGRWCCTKYVFGFGWLTLQWENYFSSRNAGY